MYSIKKKERLGGSELRKESTSLAECPMLLHLLIK